MNKGLNRFLAYMQEFWIRHIDGSPFKSDAERQRVTEYLETAIERRVSMVGIVLHCVFIYLFISLVFICYISKIQLISSCSLMFREFRSVE